MLFRNPQVAVGVLSAVVLGTLFGGCGCPRRIATPAPSKPVVGGPASAGAWDVAEQGEPPESATQLLVDGRLWRPTEQMTTAGTLMPGLVWKCDAEPSDRVVDLRSEHNGRRIHQLYRRILKRQRFDGESWKDHGRWEAWLFNGEHDVANNQNGEFYGPRILTDGSGRVIARENYVNGQLHGHAEWRQAPGVLVEADYAHGVEVRGSINREEAK